MFSFTNVPQTQISSKSSLFNLKVILNTVSLTHFTIQLLFFTEFFPQAYLKQSAAFMYWIYTMCAGHYVLDI